MTDITLYGYATSPYVMKVAAYLKYKKLDYTFVHVRPKTNEQIRFTQQTQVPVLKIGEEWRTESSELGWWLDELYPKPSLDSEEESQSFLIRDIDQWISDTMIPARFREALDWDDNVTAIRSGWRLASIVNGGTPLPLHWRFMWPWAVKNAPFIVRMVNELDRKETMPHMRQRILDEFETHLGQGPYLGSLQQPSLADLSAYPVMISGWLMGVGAHYPWMLRPKILHWMEAVQSHLPDNPLACANRFIVRKFPWERKAA